MQLFTNGERALQAAHEEPPDVVLLDVRMPGLNGYDVCRRFKANSGLRDIPILFLSALSSTEEMEHGFACGAVDYITKPFREGEMLARVRAHLSSRNAYMRLAARHQHLRQLEQQRDAHVHMMVHDMRSPLLAILGHLQIICTYGGKRLQEKDRASLRAAIHGTRTLVRMVSTVIDLSRMENAQLKLNRRPTAVRDLFESAREQVLDPSDPHPVTEHIPDSCPQVLCDVDVSVRIFSNLLANAVKFAPDTSGIALGAEPEGNGVRLWVRDQGPGIDPADHEAIFEKYRTGAHPQEKRWPSTGIGLAFCKLASELQGGRIGVESAPGRGSTFWVTLPKA